MTVDLARVLSASCAAILLAACGFTVSRRPEADTEYGSIHTLLATSNAYRDRFSGYPETLAQLGPPSAGSPAGAKGAGLIDPVLASGVKSGYQYTYIPGPPEMNGVIRTFAITVRPLKYEGPSTPSYLTTESGIIRYTTEDRAATDVDPPLRRE